MSAPVPNMLHYIQTKMHYAELPKLNRLISKIGALPPKLTAKRCNDVPLVCQPICDLTVIFIFEKVFIMLLFPSNNI